MPVAGKNVEGLFVGEFMCAPGDFVELSVGRMVGLEEAIVTDV